MGIKFNSNSKYPLIKFSVIAVIAAAINAPAMADMARDWQNLPVNTNVFFAYYVNVRSNTSVDTDLPIADASLDGDIGMLRYARSFDLGNGLSSGIQVLQPYASLDAALGSFPSQSRSGWGDTTVIGVANIFGAKAMTPEEFMHATPTPFLTGALWVVAPTGSYDGNKQVNIGSHRWSFKPELAYGLPFGDKLQQWLELNAFVSFYTDNGDYQGGKKLEQKPKLGLEAHYSYTFKPGLYASADLSYAGGGETTLNGLDQDNRANSWMAGFGGGIAFSVQDAVSISYMQTFAHADASPDVRSVMAYYRHAW